MGIVMYQLAIFLSIVISSFYSKKLRDIIIGIWVIWTIAMVYTIWLAILQLITIVLSTLLTEKINSVKLGEAKDDADFVGEEFGKPITEVISEMIGGILKVIVIIGIVGFIIFMLIDMNSHSSNKPHKEKSKQELCRENKGFWEYDSNTNIYKCIPSYSLLVDVIPKDARIRIMNIKPKYYDGIRLKPGRYDIKVDKYGYYTNDFYIELTQDSIYDSVLQRR